MTKKDDETGGELTPIPNDKYKKFFAKFEEIETLDVSQWKVAHILGYFCKKYKETYGVHFDLGARPPKLGSGAGFEATSASHRVRTVEAGGFRRANPRVFGIRAKRDSDPLRSEQRRSHPSHAAHEEAGADSRRSDTSLLGRPRSARGAKHRIRIEFARHRGRDHRAAVPP